jgi:hypothetical protein
MAEKNNPKVGLEKNYFIMTGTVSYRPQIYTTNKAKKPMASFIISQTREAGANYETYTRKYNILSFDDAIISSLMSLISQAKVEIKGNITVRSENTPMGMKTEVKLIATELTIVQELEEQFTLTKKEKILLERNQVEVPKTPYQLRKEKLGEILENEVKPAVEAEDEDLPF